MQFWRISISNTEAVTWGIVDMYDIGERVAEKIETDNPE